MTQQSALDVPAGQREDELKGCRGILLAMGIGACLWLAIIGGIVWLA